MVHGRHPCHGFKHVQVSVLSVFVVSISRAEPFRSLIFPRWDVIAIILSVFLMTYTYIEAKSNYHRGSILILRWISLFGRNHSCRSYLISATVSSLPASGMLRTVLTNLRRPVSRPSHSSKPSNTWSTHSFLGKPLMTSLCVRTLHTPLSSRLSLLLTSVRCLRTFLCCGPNIVHCCNFVTTHTSEIGFFSLRVLNASSAVPRGSS
jgi:hypothetical protein